MRKLVATILFGAAGLATAGPANKAKLTLGTPTVARSFDVKGLTATLARTSDNLLTCFTTSRAGVLGLQGTATATFTIGADGKATATAAAGLGKDVETCITATLAKLTFPKPKDGQPVKVSYPLAYDAGVEPGAFASLTGTADGSNGSDDTDIYGGLLGNELGQSGLGVPTAGAGGGGTGWGTIGTGRYGTIGHGSGTSSGYGISSGHGMLGHTSGGASVSFGQAVVNGGLDKALIRRYIKRNLQRLTYCYEKQLVVKPDLEGTVTAEFTIGANGIVRAATASGVDKDVSSCVAGVIQAIEFPKPKTDEVKVSCPLMLHPPAPAAAKAAKPEDAKPTSAAPDKADHAVAKPDAAKPDAARPDAAKK